MTKKKYDITVSAHSEFVADHSDVDNKQYAFAYMITIENKGSVGAQLITRHWVITDANEKLQEIHGEGVVGEQPFLRPGESFSYTSNTLLETPVGTMRGDYGMLAEDGTRFNAKVKEFTLSIPRTLH